MALSETASQTSCSWLRVGFFGGFEAHVEKFKCSRPFCDYCARVDSKSADKYQLKKKDLVKDVPESEVAEARKTEEYKAGYEWIDGELAKMPKDEIVSACAAALNSKN